MEIDREFLEHLQSRFNEGLTTFRDEVKTGFADLAKRMDGTNARIDQTNARIDQTNAHLDQTNARLDQNIARLDQTNVRLDAAINMVRDFRKDVSSKLDEVGGYLHAINGNVLQHEERIKSLEQRMERLERTG